MVRCPQKAAAAGKVSRAARTMQITAATDRPLDGVGVGLSCGTGSAVPTISWSLLRPMRPDSVLAPQP